MAEKVERKLVFEAKEKEKKDPLTQVASEAATCGYTVRKKIGGGHFGSVFSVTKTDDIKEGLKALKVINKVRGVVGLPNLVEIDILSRLRQPHLMYLEDILVPDPKSGCQIEVEGLILPLASYNLADLRNNSLVSPDMKLKILYQVFCAVRFLHLQGILHFDLSSNNIVLQGSLSDLHPLVTDFSISRYVEDLQGGTYLDKGEKTDLVTQESDVVDLGLLLVEFLGITFSRGKGDFSNMKEAEALVSRMTALDSHERIELSEVLEDPLFAKVAHKGCPVGYVVPAFTEGVPFLSQAPVDTLITLGEILVLNFPEAKTEVLFLALDLLQRTGHIIGDLEDNQSLIHLHLSTCVWMAVKMLVIDPQAPSGGFKSTSGITIPPEDTVSVEAVIVKFLEGRLYRRWLYHAARNVDDLVAGYHLLRRPEVNLNQNPKEIIQSFPFHPGSDFHSKNITVEGFLRVVEKE